MFAGEIRNNDMDLIGVKAGVVDGKTLKADTWYTLEDGEWKEVPDADADN